MTSRSIFPALPHLLEDGSMISGLASINYRLSPYPDHSTDPSSEDDPARNAMHPDHIQDTLTAVAWLQRNRFGGCSYIVAGHSAGATLAFQLTMGMWAPYPLWLDQDPDGHIPLPAAIVGVEGIYDLEALLDSYPHVPVYRRFFEAAFGKNRSVCRKASPAEGGRSAAWPDVKAVILAHSPDDELVDYVQTEKMSHKLSKSKREGRRDSIISLQGRHDEIVRGGKQLARAIATSLHTLTELGVAE